MGGKAPCAGSPSGSRPGALCPPLDLCMQLGPSLASVVFSSFLSASVVFLSRFQQSSFGARLMS